MTQDDTQAKVAETVAQAREMRDFLAGSGPLFGRWFGDGTIPAFWWRKHLDRFDALAAENAAMAADIATLRECAKAEMERAEKAEAERDELDFLLHEGGEDSVANLIEERDRLAEELAAARATIEWIARRDNPNRSHSLMLEPDYIAADQVRELAHDVLACARAYLAKGDTP